jgi:hypothetical protein
MNSREMARRQSSPYTGKFSARPAGQRGGFLRSGEFATIPSRHSVGAAASTIPRRLGCVFKAWRNLSGPMGFQNQNQTLAREHTASGRSAPGQGQRTRREDHALSHRPQMSSGRLFLDRVGRHQSPSPLRRHEQINTHSSVTRPKGDISTLPARGHFYFALTQEPLPLTS